MSATFRLFVPDDAGGVTVTDVVSAYLDWLNGRVIGDGFDPEAFATISRGLSRFAVHFPHEVTECRQHDLTIWLEFNKGWKSGHTKRREIAAILTCFIWASNPEEHAEPLIKFNPYRMPKCVSEIPYKPRRPAEHSEYVTLMRGGSRSLRLALFFMRRTGARTIEMREVIWRECLLDGESPHICREKNKTKRRTGKPRKIGLDVGLANFLRALRRREKKAGRGRDGDRVFTNSDGNPWTRGTFGTHLRRHAARLGLDDGSLERITAYCVRHTYACDGVEACVTDHRIADQMGLSSTAMIRKVYASHTRHRPEHLANVANEITGNRRRKK